jgi:hypothetical protein
MKINRLIYTPPLLLALLGLAACFRSNPAVPTPFPTNSYDLTSIAQTMLPLPSSTDTPSISPSPDQTATLPALNPQKFIYFYFDNINNRNYSMTWSLLTSRFQSKSGGYQAYVDFWNSVKLATVGGAFYTCQGDLCAVDVILRLDYINGNYSLNTISYTLIRDHTRNTWMFDIIPIPSQTPTRTTTRTATSTLTRTATATRTPTATATRTGTLTLTTSATPTRTGTLTLTLSATPTRTGTLTNTPSGTPSGTGTPTPSGTATLTLTSSETPTPTFSPTASGTATASETPTWTETPTETSTETSTETPTGTPTETATMP